MHVPNRGKSKKENQRRRELRASENQSGKQNVHLCPLVFCNCIPHMRHLLHKQLLVQEDQHRVRYLLLTHL